MLMLVALELGVYEEMNWVDLYQTVVNQTGGVDSKRVVVEKHIENNFLFSEEYIEN